MAGRCQLQRAVSRCLPEPALVDEVAKELSSELSGKMITAFGSVQATIGHTAPTFGRAAQPIGTVYPQFAQA